MNRLIAAALSLSIGISMLTGCDTGGGGTTIIPLISTNNGETAVTGVILNKENATIPIGGTEQLIATILPSDATNQNLMWLSSNNAVATVSLTGLVSAINPGSATITVITQDGIYIDSASVYIGSDYVRVRNSIELSIPDGVQTIITFDTEVSDINDMHDSNENTGRLLALRSGVYIITGELGYYGDAIGERQLFIVKNGAVVIGISSVTDLNTVAPYISLSTTVFLDAGDYVELQTYQNSGGTLNIGAGEDYTPCFMMANVLPVH